MKDIRDLITFLFASNSGTVGLVGATTARLREHVTAPKCRHTDCRRAD